MTILLSYSFSDAYVAIGDDSGIPPDRHCGVSGEAFALAQAQKVPLIYYSDRATLTDRERALSCFTTCWINLFRKVNVKVLDYSSRK